MTTVWSDAPGFVPPDIVIQYDWPELLKLDDNDSDWYGKPLGKLRDAVEFLLDAIKKMTGRTLSVRGSVDDFTRGIVFTTLASAPPDISTDPAVGAALADDGTGPYNANEAYYVRTEADRVILVANTTDGLVNAAVALAESVGYHVLGMGPNWVDVPDCSHSLVFDTECSGRPGFYLRVLAPTSAQSKGIGTIVDETAVGDPDETVAASYQRWRVGVRITSRSVPAYPGHALQNYHQQVAARIRSTGDTAGFLAPTRLGPDAERPAAPTSSKLVWINNDVAPAPGAGKVYFWANGAWTLRPGHVGACLDLSVQAVREVVLEVTRAMAEAAFKSWPDDVAQLAIEPEDSGPPDAEFDHYRRNPNWFPDYLAANGLPFGAAYALNGPLVDQPVELWDRASRSDTIYGFALWLLHEYDRWIDGLSSDEQVTKTGKSKKALIRATFMSYSDHDVPPNFNIGDQRVRVMVSGSSPKHRGTGKWKNIKSDLDVVAALRVWLPDPGTYHVFSNAGTHDWGLAGIPVVPDLSAKTISDSFAELAAAGVRARTIETDFNFGKFGLGYYLMARKMWDPAMSAADLDKVREHWLRCAFGTAWLVMMEYYDFLLASTFPGNTPASWAHAIQLITDADELVDPTAEPAVKRRIDDLKQYWYCYYLQASGDAAGMQAFVWRGQMSYMNAMYVVMTHVYPTTTNPAVAAGPVISAGPAHYLAAQTATWWAQVRAFWPV